MRRLLFCLLMLATLVVSVVSYADSTHALAVKPLRSTTLLTLQGSGIQQTGTFKAPSRWTLAWTCDPTSFNGFNYNVIVFVYRSNGMLAGVAINAMCTASTTYGSTQIHLAGPVYLEINSEAAWTIQAHAP